MFSHSRINCFKQCPKLFQYKYIDKLEPLGADSKALSIGKAVHYGIEHNNSDAALEFMEKDPYFMSDQDETNKVLVLAMVDAYLQKFPNEQHVKHEINLTMNLLGLEDDYTLFLDGLEETSDGYWLHEVKTASQVNESYIKKLDFIDQPSRYYYVAEKRLNKPILGIKYRIIKKPLLRLKQGEATQQFRTRLVERLMEDDSIIEVILYRTNDQIIDCIEDTKYDMKVIQDCTRYTKNLSSCSLYGECPYIELCRGTKDAELLFSRKEEENVTEERESE